MEGGEWAEGHCFMTSIGMAALQVGLRVKQEISS